MSEVSKDSLLASVIREFGTSVEFDDTLARISVGSELLAFSVDKDAIDAGAPSETVITVSSIDKRDEEGVICNCYVEGKDGFFLFLMGSDGRFALQQGEKTLFDSSRDDVMLFLDVDMASSPASHDVDEVLPELPDDVFDIMDEVDEALRFIEEGGVDENGHDDFVVTDLELEKLGIEDLS